MSEAIKKQATEVLSARRYLSDSKGMLRIMREEFEAEHAGTISTIKALEEKLATEETALRDLALAAYAADLTNKHPGPGVGIRDQITYDYDSDSAFEWAKEHGMCLQLNHRAYTALVKAGQAPGTEKTEPVATIATDLAKALEGEAVPQGGE